MIFSTKYSYLVLRCGLAIVFFWFGLDAFFHPASWLHVWLSNLQSAYIIGIFEVLIGLSLITGVFMRLFALVGIALLIAAGASAGLNEVTVRNAGLVGGLLAIVLWPEHGKR